MPEHAVRRVVRAGRGHDGPVRSAVRAVRVRARRGRQVLGAAARAAAGPAEPFAAAPEGRRAEHRRELRAAAAAAVQDGPRRRRGGRGKSRVH